MDGPWQINPPNREADQASRFARFPAACQDRPNAALDMVPRFLTFRGHLHGSINVPERAISDLRYRLIQLHEMLHAYHYDARRDAYRYRFRLQRPEANTM